MSKKIENLAPVREGILIFEPTEDIGLALFTFLLDQGFAPCLVYKIDELLPGGASVICLADPKGKTWTVREIWWNKVKMAFVSGDTDEEPRGEIPSPEVVVMLKKHDVPSIAIDLDMQVNIRMMAVGAIGATTSKCDLELFERDWEAIAGILRLTPIENYSPNAERVCSVGETVSRRSK